MFVDAQVIRQERYSDRLSEFELMGVHINIVEIDNCSARGSYCRRFSVEQLDAVCKRDSSDALDSCAWDVNVHDVCNWDSEIRLQQCEPRVVADQEKVVVGQVDVLFVNDGNGVGTVDLRMGNRSHMSGGLLI